MRSPRRLLFTFDFTGTLAHTHPPVGVQYANACKKVGVILEPELAQKAFMDAFCMAKRDWPNYGVGHLVSTKSWWRRCVQETIMRTMDLQAERGETTQHDKQHTKEVFDKIFDDLYSQFGTSSSYKLFDDVKPSLDRLKAEKHRLAVVSNSDERLPEILQSLGILDKLDFVVVSSQFGVRKPDPSIFREALRRGNCSGDDAVHVGDQELSDCEGALNAGFSRSFLVKRDNPEFCTGQKVKSLHQRSCIAITSLSQMWDYPPLSES